MGECSSGTSIKMIRCGSARDVREIAMLALITELRCNSKRKS
jgi:hypothetical protein